MTVTTSNKKPSFKPTKVTNFTGAYSVEVRTSGFTKSDELVTIRSEEGGLSFHSSMKPEQARELAAALIAAADSLEG